LEFLIFKLTNTHHAIKLTKSVYASGIIKAENQYQVFSNVNGIIQQFIVTDGDILKVETTLITLQNGTSKLNFNNAKLAANYNDFDDNQSKLNELKTSIE
jgi:HlyD family secretion protein